MAVLLMMSREQLKDFSGKGRKGTSDTSHPCHYALALTVEEYVGKRGACYYSGVS